MRYLAVIWFTLWGVTSAFCQVTRVEYFVDTDPGIGKATRSLTLNPNDLGVKDFNLTLTDVSEGNHILYVRARDAQGHWSHTQGHSFYVVTNTTATVGASEYFIDTDPGHGKATPVTAAPSADSSRQFVVPLAEVTEGYHTLFIRTKDNQQHWSHTLAHSFYVVANKATAISATEYFLDTDPGIGKATPATATPDADGYLRFVVPLTTASKGFHTLSARTKDNLGHWSQTQQHVFYNNASGGTLNITALKYYFIGNGQTSATYTYPAPTPAPLVDLDFPAKLSDLEANREYVMHIWAVNSEGARSGVITKKIKVCNGEPTKANFDFIPLGTQVSFIDSSRNATKYYWDFGDGTVDSVSNPVHTYSEGGNYEVKLIASNFCNSNTLVKKVNVLSLQSIHPKSGGNDGNVTLSIIGGGFTKTTKIYLVGKNKKIEGFNFKTEENGKVLYAVFNVSNEELGYWDIEVSNNGNTHLLPKTFLMELPHNLGIKTNIIGRTTFRAGRSEKFIITYYNDSNNDVFMIPLSLVFPKDVKIDLISELAKLSGLPGLPVFDEEKLPKTLDVGDKTVLPLIIHHIPANGSGQIELSLTAPNLPKLPLTVLVNQPLVKSVKLPNQNSTNNPISAKCLTFNIGVALTVFGLTAPELACAGAASLATLEFSNSVASLFIMTPGGETVGSVLISTGSFVQSLAGLSASLLFCAGVEISRPVTLGIAGVGGLLTLASIISDGDECHKQLISAIYNLSSLTSYDPNEKRGPIGNDNVNYNQGAAFFDYKIYFENKDTADLPAQEVVVLDTLDITKFDLSTFQLKSFGFGDTIGISIPAGLQAYSTSTLLQRPGKADLLVRVDAKLDTAAGILTWRFLSLDPVTRELIDDPLDGFLPPNKISPEGEGSISYSVLPKKELAHGTEIKNKATIYFDVNPPIVTNEFLNTIDKQNPASNITALPPETQDTTFSVNWSGTDAGAGVRSYDVYYAVNNGPFRLWQYDVTAAAGKFAGKVDSTYAFYSIAKDYAGNMEPSKTAAEAATTVVKRVTGLPGNLPDGFTFKSYPNPTENKVLLEFTLPAAEQISLVLYDVLGRRTTVMKDKKFAAGTHTVPYDLKQFPAGLYICELKGEKFVTNLKILKQ